MKCFQKYTSVFLITLLLAGSITCLADGIDTFLVRSESVGTGNGIDTEEAWVREQLNILGLPDALFHLKYEADPDPDVEPPEYYNPDVVQGWEQDTSHGDDDVWKSQFADPAAEPDYFLIKTGRLDTVSGMDYRYFLFDNVESLSWAVIDLSDMFGIGEEALASFIPQDDFGKFSHISVFLSPVPEPSSLAMLILGMCGVFIKRRRE